MLSAERRVTDEPIDAALRPERLDEMIGQGAVLDKLRIALTAAKRRRIRAKVAEVEGDERRRHSL